MKHNIPVSEEGYAILKAIPLDDTNLVVTEICPFCSIHHTHVNPKKDQRGDIPLRKSHCVDKKLMCVSNKGLLVGNHIYYLDVDEHDTRSTKTED
jgi:hypothetical protein